jgi:hypothetical protein
MESGERSSRESRRAARIRRAVEESEEKTLGRERSAKRLNKAPLNSTPPSARILNSRDSQASPRNSRAGPTGSIATRPHDQETSRYKTRQYARGANECGGGERQTFSGRKRRRRRRRLTAVPLAVGAEQRKVVRVLAALVALDSSGGRGRGKKPFFSAVTTHNSQGGCVGHR